MPKSIGCAPVREQKHNLIEICLYFLVLHNWLTLIRLTWWSDSGRRVQKSHMEFGSWTSSFQVVIVMCVLFSKQILKNSYLQMCNLQNFSRFIQLGPQPNAVNVTYGISLLSMDKVWKQKRITNEKYGCVVSDKIPISLLRVEPTIR